MSLLGAIENYYLNGVSEELTALRTELGENKIWADVIPTEIPVPFIAVSETATRLVTEPKGQRSKVVDITVTFDVEAVSRAAVEKLLDLLDDAFGTKQLEIENASHLATHFGNRTQDWKGSLNWHGTLDLNFRVQK